MLDFGSNPIERQLVLSAQFLHQELPVRLAHRVAELENLPYGLSVKPHVVKVGQLYLAMNEAHCSHGLTNTVLKIHTTVQVRDWYVESFRDLRDFPTIKDHHDELNFTKLLKHIYHRHRYS